MDVSTISAVMALAGVMFSAWIGFLGSKKGTLADAEKDFRATILQDNKDLRERIEELEERIDELVRENTRLQIKLELKEEDEGTST